MKGVHLSKKKEEWTYGIVKNDEMTENYVSTFKRLISDNRAKICENFITVNPLGKNFILEKAKNQLGAFVRRRIDGKLTGKGDKNEKNDDLAVVMMMPGEFVRLSKIIEHPFNQQLFGNSFL
jgi:hypothetical protein